MAHITRATDALTTKTEGPFAIARGCRLCGFVLTRRRGHGRGAGFREGNKQRGEMHSHMKDTHPKALAEVVAILAADGNQSINPIMNFHELKKLDNKERA